VTAPKSFTNLMTASRNEAGMLRGSRKDFAAPNSPGAQNIQTIILE
jgi:hypothetical protein